MNHRPRSGGEFDAMDRQWPTLRQVQSFLAVAETSSFRGAAARMRVSQPTVTHQILALEQRFGLQLFERSRGGTNLTSAARELLPVARRALEQMQGLSDRAESLARGPAGTYRLGVTPTLGPYLLPHVLPPIHRRYAALKLYVREDAPRNLESGLAAGEYDLILSALPVEQSGLTVVPLFHEPVQLVMSSDHRLANKTRISRLDLADESVLTIEEHHHFHRQIQDLCAQLGAHVLRDYEGTSLDTLRQMVVMGMGIAFLPSLYIRSEIHRSQPLRVTAIHGEPVHRTHALAWRNASPSGQLFREIAEEIRAYVEKSLSDVVRVASSQSGE
jgi:LysR family hydrogen peroxide-inducible transcriptional activator